MVPHRGDGEHARLVSSARRRWSGANRQSGSSVRRSTADLAAYAVSAADDTDDHLDQLSHLVLGLGPSQRAADGRDSAGTASLSDGRRESQVVRPARAVPACRRR